MAGERTVKIRFRGEADTAGASRQASRDVEAVGNSFEGMTGAATKAAAGVALAFEAVGGATDIIGEAIANLDVPNKLQAQLGAGTEAAAQAGRVAGDLYADGWGDGLGMVADATRTVATEIKGLNDSDLGDVTEKGLALAEAFGVDVVESARAAGQMVKSGLVDEATGAYDLLTVAYRKLGATADDVLDTSTEYGVQFEALGLTGKQVFGLFAQGGEQAARNTDLVADAFKEFHLIVASGSKVSQDALKRLGLDAKDMQAAIAKGGPGAAKALDSILDRLRVVEDPVVRNATAIELFGTKAEDLQGALYAFDPSTAVAALGEVDGAAKDMADSLDNGPNRAITEAKRAATTYATEVIGGQLIPKIIEIAKWFKEAFGPQIKWVTDLLGGNQAAVGNLVLGLGGLLVLYGTVRGAMALYATVAGVAKIAQDLLNGSMKANPIGLVITAIMLLVGAFVALWNKSESFRNFWIGLWRTVRDAVGTAVDWVKRKWEELLAWFRGIPDWFSRLGSSIGEGIKAGFKGAVNWIIDRLNGLVDGFNWVIRGVNVISPWDIPEIPHIPHMATGGTVLRDGLAVVGERGRELVHLPAGAQVTPNRDTEALLDGMGGGVAVDVYLGDEPVEGIVERVTSRRDRTARRFAAMGPGGGW